MKRPLPVFIAGNKISNIIIKYFIKFNVCFLISLILFSRQYYLFLKFVFYFNCNELIKYRFCPKCNRYRFQYAFHYFAHIFKNLRKSCCEYRLTTYLFNNDILSTAQHGFKSNHSTTTALCDALNFVISALDNHLHKLSVYLDISKIFDLVNHSISKHTIFLIMVYMVLH